MIGCLTHGFVRNDRGDLRAGHDTSEETEEDRLGDEDYVVDK